MDYDGINQLKKEFITQPSEKRTFFWVLECLNAYRTFSGTLQKCTVEKRLGLMYVLYPYQNVYCWKKTGYCCILTRNARETAELGVTEIYSNFHKKRNSQVETLINKFLLLKMKISGIHRLIFLFTIYSGLLTHCF